jgi:hypothetical protein
MEIIAGALSELPPPFTGCDAGTPLGIYFVKIFLGSGLTDWVVDKDNNIYTYMIIQSGDSDKKTSRT